MKYFALTAICFLSAALYSNDTVTGRSAYPTYSDSTSNINTNKAEKIRIIEDSINTLYNKTGLAKFDLSLEVFRYSMIGYYNLLQQGKLDNNNIITIIDFAKPSVKKRLYTISIQEQRVLFHTYVSHGKNTGENFAKSFSNIVHSNQSSMGFSITAETYVGSKGYSLKLDGLETGYNTNMRQRAVVMHDAEYVSETWIAKYGRLGRSQGCPALPKEISRKVIDTIKGGSMIYTHFPDQAYLKASPYLNINSLINSDLALTAVAP